MGIPSLHTAVHESGRRRRTAAYVNTGLRERDALPVPARWCQFDDGVYESEAATPPTPLCGPRCAADADADADSHSHFDDSDVFLRERRSRLAATEDDVDDTCAPALSLWHLPRASCARVAEVGEGRQERTFTGAQLRGRPRLRLWLPARTGMGSTASPFASTSRCAHTVRPRTPSHEIWLSRTSPLPFVPGMGASGSGDLCKYDIHRSSLPLVEREVVHEASP